MVKNTLIAALAFLFFSLDAQVKDSIILDSLIVTNSRIGYSVKEVPRSISIIAKSQIDENPSLTLPELLQSVAGLDIRRRGPLGVQADVSLRGGSFDQVLILINGVRMNDAQTGHHTLYVPIEMLDIERIEVIKGPAARTFGQNAFSGAINIVTKQAKDVGSKAYLGYGSFDTRQLGLSTGLSFFNDKFSHAIYLNDAKSDGYDYNRDFTQRSIHNEGKIRLNKESKLEYMFGFSDRKFGANGFYALPTHKDQYEEVFTSISSVSLTKVTNNWSVKPRISYRYNDDYYEFVRDKPEIFSNKTTGKRLTLDLNTSYYSGQNTFAFGVEYSRENMESIRLGDRERNILSAFVEDKIRLANDKLLVSGGLFINKFSDRDVQIFPGLDIAYFPTSKMKIYVSGNMANRIPTYTDLYYTSRAEIGNASLTNESISGLDAGISYTGSAFDLSLSVFRNETQDLIDWTKQTTKDTVWIARNFVAANFTGAEISGSWNIAKAFDLKNRFSASLGLTFIDANTANQTQTYVTRYQFNHLGKQINAGLNLGITKGLSLNVNSRTIDRVNEDKDPISGDNLLDATIFDAALDYKFGSYKIRAIASNLTNQKYKEISNVLMPGRWWQFVFGYGL
jgi:vitamin B12 transporter